ncbi:murein transglycosylase A [Pseudoroseicyclus aestuarii]|uniref:peptidoglycan lytic exotransglycosylase n=1 Tax=Pseudoroseicyclus aestuarii TaxID=1795041 RepID=A0A318SSD9_9RHOB|nr:MltA domain-containing protein [Pseudoroseicyclus aestuarii]PYE84452.1 membrane-bound lytic murein transglycosylase A [Pseudoroseicyclus aestuarii]
MIRGGALAAAGLLSVGLSTGVAANGAAEPDVAMLSFADLEGWEEDDHGAALDAFRETCRDLRDQDWQVLCALSAETRDARAFFEAFFLPVQIGTEEEGLFTGYYEPQIVGRTRPQGRYTAPVYRLPEDPPSDPWPTRRQIEEDGILSGQDLEIAWVDPVDLFFLQIQGSGRIRMPGGTVIRLGYAGANGQPYDSIGQELVARGEYDTHQVSAAVIRSWINRNPDAGRELMWHNRSYVFFRVVNEVPADRGPLGAMNRSLTPLRSLAVDPAHVPLGAPVWIEAQGTVPMNRLMVAQDTGSAIKGAQRGDIFFGTGSGAGSRAGRVRDSGRIVTLLPIQRAWDMMPVQLATADG